MKKPYLNADDYLNLFYICLLIVVCIQGTRLLFPVPDVAKYYMSWISIAVLIISLFFLAKFFINLRKPNEKLSEEEAKSILLRYIREHKGTKKIEEVELIRAIRTLLKETDAVEVQSEILKCSLVESEDAENEIK